MAKKTNDYVTREELVEILEEYFGKQKVSKGKSSTKTSAKAAPQKSTKSNHDGLDYDEYLKVAKKLGLLQKGIYGKEYVGYPGKNTAARRLCYGVLKSMEKDAPDEAYGVKVVPITLDAAKATVKSWK